MTTTIDAIFTGGLFKPINAIDLPENQQVRLFISPREPLSAAEWLTAAREHRRNMEARHGILPDSMEEIRANRYRDE